VKSPIHIYQTILEKFLTPEKTPRRTQYASGMDFVLAVSGAAASGKTSFCQGLVNYLAGKEFSAVHLPLDGYLLDREIRNRRNLSGYDPRSSDLPAMIDQMKAFIYEGRSINFTSDDIVIRGLRLRVDMEERGYSVFQALVHSDEEFVSYNKWIYPQITFAHLKIWVDKERELSIKE